MNLLLQALTEPPVSELKGPMELVVYDGEEAEFHCRATGSPAPSGIGWSVGREPLEGHVLLDFKEGEGFREETIKARVRDNCMT